MKAPFRLSDAQHADFDRDGYLLASGFLSDDELALVRDTARGDAELAAAARPVRDGGGRDTSLALWNDPGDDVLGVLARTERIVGTMERLLGDEVYHYHSKLSAKPPRVGGSWEWHQDYGYWYAKGCLLPDMASVFIALDPCTRENGCLQALRGSHRMGRIQHDLDAAQVQADAERVRLASERFEHVWIEMPAGAALFFHCNLLHRSDPNESDAPRWGLICCYNTKHNDPVLEGHHASYKRLDRLPDSALLRSGASAPGTRDFVVRSTRSDPS